jgi:hypothetical protein
VRIFFRSRHPAPLRWALTGHEIATAFERGWGTLQNGELLRAVEAAGFEAIITTDQNLRYQQNLEGRRLAILVLLTTDWRLIRQHTDYVVAAVAGIARGTYVELPFPPTKRTSS